MPGALFQLVTYGYTDTFNPLHSSGHIRIDTIEAYVPAYYRAYCMAMYYLHCFLQLS